MSHQKEQAIQELTAEEIATVSGAADEFIRLPDIPTNFPQYPSPIYFDPRQIRDFPTLP